MTNESDARALKAIAIAHALRSAGCDADTAEALTDDDWQLAARVATHQTNEQRAAAGNHFRPVDWTDASWPTRSLVLTILRTGATHCQIAAEAAYVPDGQQYTNGDDVTITITDDGQQTTHAAVYVRPSNEHPDWHQVRLCTTGRSVMVSGPNLAPFVPSSIEDRHGPVVTERAVQSTGTPAPNPIPDHLARRTCSCGRPAVASWFDSGPFGAGTFYGCDDHKPADLGQAPADDERALEAAVTAAIGRRAHPGPAPASEPQEATQGFEEVEWPERDPAYLNWCEERHLDPEDGDTAAMYSDWLDDNDRESLRR